VWKDDVLVLVVRAVVGCGRLLGGSQTRSLVACNPRFGFHCSAEPFVALYVRTWSLELGVLSGDTEPVTHPTHAPASRDQG
jgi:hypothetical protein